jgi:MFS family permease
VQSYLSAHSARARHGVLFGLQNLVGGLGFGLGPLAASWISIRTSTRHVFLSYTLAFAAITLLMLVARLLGRHFTRGLPPPPQEESV